MSSEDLAGALLAAYDGATRLALPTDQDPAFDVDTAYAVADDIRGRRIARGEMPRGYKIGFTNRSIWSRYGVYAPIWGSGTARSPSSPAPRASPRWPA
jgi:2-keto-4-pentenoate hydratase